MSNDWCEADDCPSIICNGPHVEHRCGDSIVTARFDNDEPCPYCGKPLNEARPRSVGLPVDVCAPASEPERTP